MEESFQVKKCKDFSKINANDLGEVVWWCYQFGTYPEKLLSLVNKLGCSTEVIRKHLQNSNGRPV